MEGHYKTIFDYVEDHGLEKFGLMSSHAWSTDPKRLTFTLARYKFVAKMLAGKTAVLEVGCGDAFASRIVRQEVGRLVALDFDPTLLKSVPESREFPIETVWHNMLDAPLMGIFDGAFALDVLEHIRPEVEDMFLGNIHASLKQDGVAIFGIPSLESQAFASELSKAGHVNCKSGPDLKRTLERHFRNVFMFGMNDETLHTGHYGMSHYLLALCSGKC